jgi:hypothetical protein
MSLGYGNTFTVLRRREFHRKWPLVRLRGDGVIHMMVGAWVRVAQDLVQL